MEVNGQPQAPHSLSLGTKTSVPTGWAPDLLSTFYRKENIFAPIAIRAPNRPARSLITTLTELHIHDAVQYTSYITFWRLSG
jgi:hypothetical protein